MTRATVRAVVFDFDGTIVDTETPVFESWRATFERAGVDPIPLATWQQTIGLADADSLDPRVRLCEGLGVTEIPDELDEFRRRVRDDMLAAEPVRAGVESWLDAVRERGVPLAVASSSPTSWVDANLARLGLRGCFETLSCADPGIPGKPDPTVYLTACETLGVRSVDALAIEDSPNGVAAARAAGLRCIAAPGPITKGADFGVVDREVASLSDLDPADWL